jgi:hypothetical protein
MRPSAHFEFTVTTRTQPFTLFSEGAGTAPSGAARPAAPSSQPCGPAGGCLHHRGRHRPHAHHSSPHPRAVQLLLIDQQIASALPLSQ